MSLSSDLLLPSPRAPAQPRGHRHEACLESRPAEEAWAIGAGKQGAGKAWLVPGPAPTPTQPRQQALPPSLPAPPLPPMSRQKCLSPADANTEHRKVLRFLYGPPAKTHSRRAARWKSGEARGGCPAWWRGDSRAPDRRRLPLTPGRPSGPGERSPAGLGPAPSSEPGLREGAPSRPPRLLAHQPAGAPGPSAALARLPPPRCSAPAPPL